MTELNDTKVREVFISRIANAIAPWLMRREMDEYTRKYEAAFDAWLAEERARAWDEGFDAGERDVNMHATFDEPCIKNPYREAQQ